MATKTVQVRALASAETCTALLSRIGNSIQAWKVASPSAGGYSLAWSWGSQRGMKAPGTTMASVRAINSNESLVTLTAQNQAAADPLGILQKELDRLAKPFAAQVTPSSPAAVPTGSPPPTRPAPAARRLSPALIVYILAVTLTGCCGFLSLFGYLSVGRGPTGGTFVYLGLVPLAAVLLTGGAISRWRAHRWHWSAWVSLSAGVLVIAGLVVFYASTRHYEAGCWARLRPDADLSGCNLSDADLTGQDLHGANLRSAGLARAKLFQVDLSGADLGSATIADADCREANLSQATLTGASFNGSDLSGAQLEGATWGRVYLAGANLQNLDLAGVELQESDLGGANLQGTNLTGAILTKADLRQADLSGARLQGANLDQAKLSATTLNGLDLSGASLRGADLTGAKLQGTNLQRVILSEATLKSADLSGAQAATALFESASLQETNLSQIDLSGANLRGADLAGANLEGATLPGVTLDSTNLVGALGLTDDLLAEALGVPTEQIAAALSVHNLRLEDRTAMLKSLQSACQGQAVAGTGHYTPGAGFHPLVLVGTKGWNHDWTSDVPSTWEPMALRFAELVACIDEIFQEKEQVSSCDYEGGRTLPSYRYHVTIRIVAADTGQTVDTRRVDGPWPSCPPWIQSPGPTAIEGEYAAFAEAEPMLADLINPR